MKTASAIVCFLALMFPSASSAVSVLEPGKRAIVCIETPDKARGTGFYLQDEVLGLFLVTNKHMLQSQRTQEFFDSVYVRKNVFNESGKVVATADREILYLKREGQALFAPHPDSNIDLAIVQCGMLPASGGWFFNPVSSDQDSVRWSFMLQLSSLASREDMAAKGFTNSLDVELISFSFASLNDDFFHISQFGHIALYSHAPMTFPFQKQYGNCTCTKLVTCDWVILDITSRGGDSGGPVFASGPGIKSITPRIIGIVMGGAEQEELCLVLPSYYILDLIDIVKSTVQEKRRGG